MRALGRPTWYPRGWVLEPGTTIDRDTAALGAVVAGLLAMADLVGVMMESWDTPAPGLGWLNAGLVGQLGLAAAAALR